MKQLVILSGKGGTGKTILFDAGTKPEVFFRNVEALDFEILVGGFHHVAFRAQQFTRQDAEHHILVGRWQVLRRRFRSRQSGTARGR